MRVPPTLIRAELLAASCASEALRRLYAVFKEHNPKFSLSLICRRSGIPSTGYLSDVINGKKTLHKKHAAAIGRGFSLEFDQAEYLRCLVERDNASDDDAVQAQNATLRRLRKVLEIMRLPIECDGDSLLQTIEVFCAFGLFGNAPRRDDLTRYFRSKDPADIDQALATLTSLNIVTLEPAGRYALLKNHVAFEDAGKVDTFKHLIKASLSDANDKMNSYTGDSKACHFETGVVSVAARTFQAKLTDLKQNLLHLQANLEEVPADMLVRFNIQVYPIQ